MRLSRQAERGGHEIASLDIAKLTDAYGLEAMQAVLQAQAELFREEAAGLAVKGALQRARESRL